MRIPKSERKTLDQLREQYEVEKELAERLRSADKEERRYLYTVLNDEFYRRVPHRSPLTVSVQVKLLRHFLNPEFTFLEVGPGDCNLAFEVAKFVKKVYAVDVSKEITKTLRRPKNFDLAISDGCNIPVPKNSVNVAYSNHLMEHLHPDDTLEQLRNIYAALALGGCYISLTPNRLSGPHDISKYFDNVARGLHLKEYTTTELAGIFKIAGFSKIKVFFWYKNFILLLPVFPVRWIEGVLSRLPYSLIKKVSGWLPVRLLLGIKLVATK